MIIYWSMLLWVPFVYLIYRAVQKSKEKNRLVGAGPSKELDIITTEKFPLAFAVIVFAYFTFWIGMRTYVMDTTQYIVSFNAISTDFSTAWSKIDWDGKSVGFDIFNIFYKCYISEDFQWWLMTIAVISILPIMLVLRKYSCDFFFSSFIFVALTIFTWPMNGMRQFICVAILFGCCDFIRDGKFFKFAIIVLLLSTIHYTSIIMLLVYFVARSKPWQFKIFIFLIIVVLVCIFAEPFFAGLEDTVLSGTVYEGATSQFAQDDGVNPMRALFFCIFPLLAFIRRKSLEEYYETEPMLPIAINMSLITAMLFVVGIFTSGILVGRLPIYCSVYNMLLIPYILKYGFNDKERTFVRLALVAIMMIMFFMECPDLYYSKFTGPVY